MRYFKKHSITLFSLSLLIVIACHIWTQKSLAKQEPIPLFVTGHASWYSERSPGIRKRTANNEIFDDKQLTCAMWGVPFNQNLKVTNINTGKSVVVRVNDRGPHKRLCRKGRVIDLTKEAFRRIGPLKNGLIKVQVEFL